MLLLSLLSGDRFAASHGRPDLDGAELALADLALARGCLTGSCAGHLSVWASWPKGASVADAECRYTQVELRMPFPSRAFLTLEGAPAKPHLHVQSYLVVSVAGLQTWMGSLVGSSRLITAMNLATWSYSGTLDNFRRRRRSRLR